jgi:hypothetical protein
MDNEGSNNYELRMEKCGHGLVCNQLGMFNFEMCVFRAWPSETGNEWRLRTIVTKKGHAFAID